MKIRIYEAKAVHTGEIVRGQLLEMAMMLDRQPMQAYYIVTGSQQEYHGIWIIEKILVYKDTIKEIL